MDRLTRPKEWDGSGVRTITAPARVVTEQRDDGAWDVLIVRPEEHEFYGDISWLFPVGIAATEARARALGEQCLAANAERWGLL